MYNDNSPNEGSSSSNESGSGHNAWAVLANTEKWISSTLESTASNSGFAAAAANNPYARKEVSYVCENQSSSSMIVAGIFRRLKESREQGEAHGEAEVERAESLGKCVCVCVCTAK